MLFLNVLFKKYALTGWIFLIHAKIIKSFFDGLQIIQEFVYFVG